MKKYLFLVLFFSFFITGCAYFNERINAAAACAADATCLADVKAKASAAKAIGDASGYPMAGALAGSLVTGLLLFFAKKKKV